MESSLRERFLWLAGLYEGEGTLEIRGNRVTIALHERDKDVIEKIKLYFGGTITSRHKNRTSSDMWCWRTSSARDTYFILVGMYQFLGNRRRHHIELWVKKFKGMRRAHKNLSRIKI